jgi:hypothetical protein
MMQQNQPVMQGSGIIWVNSDAEADNYPLAPNNAITLWHRTPPVVYFKQADASGRPSMRIYDLVERKNVPAEEQRRTNVEYATRQDMSAVEESIKELRAELKILKKDAKRGAAEDDE